MPDNTTPSDTPTDVVAGTDPTGKTDPLETTGQPDSTPAVTDAKAQDTKRGRKAKTDEPVIATDRDSVYYVLKEGVGNNIVGDTVDVSGYSDKKLARLIEEGKIGTEAPEIPVTE